MPRYANPTYNARRRSLMAYANGRQTKQQAINSYERTAATVSAALAQEDQPMIQETNTAILDRLDQQNLILSTIAESLAALASASLPESPNYRYAFDEYARGAWLGEIGAKVTESDDHGPTWVTWQGRRWRRHYAEGDNGRPPSIWFSRSTADDEGKAQWYTLATFRRISEAKPMSGQAPNQPTPQRQPLDEDSRVNQQQATNGNGNGFEGGQLVTEPQRRAIGALSEALGNDKNSMEALLFEVSDGRTKYAEALTKDEASQMIDRMKKQLGQG